ncbi:unnamed protein product [Symbiodinium microadriaticum]|nr:unnamed protein product [Symbiodinium microadriaticum]
MYNYTTGSAGPGSTGGQHVSWVPKITKPASKVDIGSSGIKIRLRQTSSAGTDFVLAKGLINDGSALLEYENQWVMLSGNMFNRDGEHVGSFTTYMKYRADGTQPDFSYDTPRSHDEPAHESAEEGKATDLSQRSGEDVGGFLEVQYLRVSHLKDVEGMFRGKNDVYVIMSVGDGGTWQHETVVRREAGDHASWEEAYSGRIPMDEVRDGMFSLAVKDRNTGSNDVLIGTANVNISPLFVRTNKWVEFDGDIKENRKVSGQYFVRLRYRDRSERPDMQSLHVSMVSLSHLVHHDSGFLGSRKNIFVELQVGDGSWWKRETAVLENVGDEAEWCDLSLCGHLDQTDLDDKDLTLTVRNSDPDKYENIVGKANIRLKQLSANMGLWLDIDGVLHRESGRDLTDKMPDGQFVITLKYVA